ncbi:MAG: SoxR reducing system RseC family protein [Prevotellaceae bacterium]|jgi:positive regulator of sigma E activity|nr:SoxR reducing system RseC family protein [Prevotellaceae bacterium]
MPQRISHTGIVENIDEHGVLVRIKPSAEQASASGTDSNFDFVQLPLWLHQLTVGEQVNVVVRQAFGKRAFMLVYLLPVVLLIASLLLLPFAGLSDGVVGLLSLGFLALYYAALYVGRHKLDREPRYSIEKIR